MFRYFLADGGYPIRKFRTPVQMICDPTGVQHLEVRDGCILRVRHYRVETRWRVESWCLDEDGLSIRSLTRSKQPISQGSVETLDTAVQVELVFRA